MFCRFRRIRARRSTLFAMAVLVSILLTTLVATELKAQGAPYMEGVGTLSPNVVEHLARNGVRPTNWSEFLNAIKRYAGKPSPARMRVLVQAIQNSNHRLWRAVIDGAAKASRSGVSLPGMTRLGGAVAYELLAEAWLVIEVAQLFYQIGHYCGLQQLNAMELEAVAADRQAIENVTGLLIEALQTGRWRLKPGWTPEQAMTQVMINMRQNRCPYFSDLIEPVPVVAPLPCVKVQRAQQAEILRDDHLRKHREMSQMLGSDDPRVVEELSLSECYRAQAEDLRTKGRL